MTPTNMTQGYLRILAVDDEPPALDELGYLLRADPRVAKVHAAADATEALRVLRDQDVDAVFLDIRMPGLDGMELARVLGRFAQPPVVVFVTAYDDRAVEAFDLGVVDYVRKPVQADRIAESLRRVLAARLAAAGPPTTAVPVVPPNPAIPGGTAGPALGAGGFSPGGFGAGSFGAGGFGPGSFGAGGEPEAEPTVPVELAGVTRMLPRAAIHWVEAQGDYARLHTGQASHLIRVPLAVLAERWADAGFVRIHRSYLVQLRHIVELRLISGGYVVVVDNRELPVSRRHTRELKDRLVRAAKQQWHR